MEPKAIANKIRTWRKDTKQGFGEAVVLLAQIEEAMDLLDQQSNAQLPKEAKVETPNA